MRLGSNRSGGGAGSVKEAKGKGSNEETGEGGVW